MTNNLEEDTEFNDALRKHGILPPKEAPPPSPPPPASPTLSDFLDDAPTSRLEGLAGEAPDSDTERMIDSYRRRRIAELNSEQRRARFGEVYPIGRDDYSREVTESSKVDEVGAEKSGLGTGVVCFLYRDGDPACVRLAAQLKTLAARHPRTKFTSTIGNKCIPDYPDRLQPTLIMYRAGEMTNQVVSWGVDRERSLEELNALLVASGVIFLDGRREPVQPQRRRGSDDEDEEELMPSVRRSGTSNTKSGVNSKQRNIRGPSTQDDDSDFDI